MKRLRYAAPFALFLLFLYGAAPASPSKDEKNLEHESDRLDGTAALVDGEQAVLKRIESDFKMSPAHVKALRDRNLGYGEIVTVYSLAESLPGGLTDAGIEKVLAIRQGPPVQSWGQVAAQLNMKLGKAVSQLKKVNDASRRDMKKEHTTVVGPPGQQQQPQKHESKYPEPARHFSGEGKSMTRGNDAQ